MKKTLKAILCVVLALTMVLSFAACSKDEAGEAPVAADNTKEAEAAVKDAMDSVLDYDVDAIKEKLGIECESKDEVLDAPGELGDEVAELFAPIIEDAFDEYVGSFEYEIGEITKDGDAYKAKVVFTCLDMDETGKKIESVFDEVDGEALMMEMINDGRITMDMTEEEMLAVVMEEMAPLVEEAFEEAMEEAETKTMDLEFVVVKDGDKWVIDTEKGDYDDLKKEIGKDEE